MNGRTNRSLLICLLIIALVLSTMGLTPMAAGPGDENGTITVYEEHFVDGTGLAVQSGGASLSHAAGKTFVGNSQPGAMYVSNRVNDWDAADFTFSALGLETGQTYTVTVVGYVDEEVEVPEDGRAVLSLVPSYTWLHHVPYVAGETFTLTAEFTVTEQNDRLRVQSNAAGASVPFYIGQIVISQQALAEDDSGAEHGEAPSEDRPPARAFIPIDFENGELNGFEPRGGNEILTVTDEANRTPGGQYALKVEGRTQAWNGPSLRVEEYIDLGHEYRIEVWVKLISPTSTTLQLSTQIGQGNSASYNNIDRRAVSVNDGWVKLEGTFRYNSVGGEYVTIYVETQNHPTASFYIDDVVFEPTGEGVYDIQRDLTPIKEVYQDYFLIGNAVSAADFDGLRFELLQMHHNLVTAENAMKPDQVYNQNREFDFTAQNQLVQRALDAGFKVHGHVLVWHQQSPTWLWQDEQGQPLSREEALENMYRHIEVNIMNYGDKVISWDVVNEAIVVNSGAPYEDWQAHLRDSGWLRAIGPDYVELAFRKAKEIIDREGWDIKLYYNDYNDHFQDKATVIYHMVKDINERYAAENDGEILISGIGMQGHYHLHEPHTAERVRQSIERFITLEGVEIGITELDITAGSGGVLTPEQEKAQAYLYAQLFVIYKEFHERISRVTFWGLDDGSSWRSDRNPLLFDRNLQAKEAYYAVIDPEGYIASYVPPEEEEPMRRGYALYGTPVIDGQIDEIWEQVPRLPIDRYLTAWEGARGEGRVLWDENHLYVLIEVQDNELDKSSTLPHEQDSVEVFVDQLNSKSINYGPGVGQYRVNFDNETSFNPAGIAQGFESATTITPGGYRVEMKIPLTELDLSLSVMSVQQEQVIGFDMQINDAQNGVRQSITTWNDPTGSAWNNPSVFGELLLVTQLPDSPGEEQPPADTDSPGTEEPGDQPGEPGTDQPPTDPSSPEGPDTGEAGPGTPGDDGTATPGETGTETGDESGTPPGEVIYEEVTQEKDTTDQGPDTEKLTAGQEAEDLAQQTGQDSAALPDTATPLYALLLIGLVTALAGLGLLWIYKKQASHGWAE